MVLLDFQEDLGRNGELVFKPVCFVQCFPFVSGAGVGRFFRLLRHLRSLGTQILQWWFFFCASYEVFGELPYDSTFDFFGLQVMESLGP